MEKSTCVMKTYHPKIDKLQCWEKKPFYATYAPRIRIEEETVVLPVVKVHRAPEVSAIVVMMILLFLFLLMGVILAFTLS